MIFQHANLMDSRTAAENVAHPLEIVKTPKAAIRSKVAELLKLVGLEGFENAYPSQLSGGQRQRVGIARALASDPDVLLCDEPTSALDPKTTDEILTLIQDLTQRLQLTVLVITHEMQVIKRICDSVSLLEAGRIVEHGPLRTVAAASAVGCPARCCHCRQPRRTRSGPVMEILYSGDSASEPVLTGAARAFEMDLNVLAGSVESLAGTQFGHLRIQLPTGADPASLARHLTGQGVAVRVVQEETA